MKGRPLAVLVDFDDTTAAQNVGEALLRRFCRGDWEGLRQQFREGRLTLRLYQELAFSHVRATPREMEEFVATHIPLRPGFQELAAFCREQGFPLAIVSNGLDFYVKALLESHGLGEVPIFAVGTRFTPQSIHFHYPYATPSCWGWGNCKCRILEGFRQQGYRIIYVGDGRSDLCPAGRADLVFARATLLRHCQEQRLPHRAFTDFRDVVLALQDGRAPWEGVEPVISGGSRD